ncbi:MAG: transposase [Chitinophagaceae bacterium]
MQLVVGALDYCRKQLGMRIYCWCLMTNHIHLIFTDENHQPSKLIGRFKEYTSKQLVKSIEQNPQESRKEWLLYMMQRAGEKSSNIKHRQLWQHHNMPIELWSPDVIEQKMDYIHNNPVVAGFVSEPQHWKYSSAADYSGGRGILDIDYV